MQGVPDKEFAVLYTENWKKEAEEKIGHRVEFDEHCYFFTISLSDKYTFRGTIFDNVVGLFEKGRQYEVALLLIKNGKPDWTWAKYGPKYDPIPEEIRKETERITRLLKE